MSDIILKNGKNFKDALKEIQKYKAPTEKKNDRYDYYSYDEYTDTMNAAFGSDGYRHSYDNFHITELSNGQLLSSLSCTIEILDEQGQVCFTAMGIGTKENERSSDKEKYVFLNNLGYLAQQAAFKSACKSLFVFLGKDKPAREDSGAVDNRVQEHGGNKDLLDIRIAVCGGMLELGNDRDSGRPRYKLICNPVVDGKEKTDNPIEVLFYPNQYMKNYNNYNGLEKFVAFMDKYKSSADPKGNGYKRFEASVLCVEAKGENAYTFKKFK